MPFGRAHVLAALALFMAFVIDSWEQLALVHVSGDLGDAFSIDTGRIGWVLSAVALGMIPGALVWGPVSDRIGRRAVCLWSLSAYGVAALASAFSPNFTVLLVTRVLSGPAPAGIYTVTFPYFLELLPSRMRGRAAVHLSIGRPIGVLAAVGVSVSARWASIPTTRHSGWHCIWCAGSCCATGARRPEDRPFATPSAVGLSAGSRDTAVAEEPTGVLPPPSRPARQAPYTASACPAVSRPCRTSSATASAARSPAGPKPPPLSQRSTSPSRTLSALAFSSERRSSRPGLSVTRGAAPAVPPKSSAAGSAGPASGTVRV